jgi:hypothetical protein
MIARTPSERAHPLRSTSTRESPATTRSRSPSPDAIEFVRFCYRRRRVGWPELYDEMCGVAGRGLFRGWGSDELSAEGIGFTLYEMPALAALVGQIVAEEHDRRRSVGGRAQQDRAGDERTGRSVTADTGMDDEPEPDRLPHRLRLAHAGA